jgi:hypothetical protein
MRHALVALGKGGVKFIPESGGGAGVRNEMLVLSVGGQREVKNGTSGQIGGHPQLPPMGLYDRPANRQPHPHPVHLGRKLRFEYQIDSARLDALPHDFNRHHQTAGVADFRP